MGCAAVVLTRDMGCNGRCITGGVLLLSSLLWRTNYSLSAGGVGSLWGGVPSLWGGGVLLSPCYLIV